jgi:hypothetical protein
LEESSYLAFAEFSILLLQNSRQILVRIREVALSDS